jgi:hypothetical protein
VKTGIQPRLLVEQVRGTAAWLWADPDAAEAARALDRVEEAEAERDAGGLAYTELLLAAHFATVATFVPTDVDARIRHHAWMAMDSEEAIARACEAVDRVSAWDARRVSARVVESARGTLSGHDGEWLSVRAGALGRAASLGFSELAARLEGAIEREVDREAEILREAVRGGAPAARVLSIATTVAHNMGDLSRVVEAWPKREELAGARARFARLGHEDREPPTAPADGHARGERVATPPAWRVLGAAGTVNKALTALENHRFLALRRPRALRASRALLLPIGPWFDAWGEDVARTLEHDDRAEVVAALLELHLSSPAQLGCLRALAGIHRATRGGLEVHVPDLPARIRKEALRGKVREAIDLPRERFEARLEKRWEAERPRLSRVA